MSHAVPINNFDAKKSRKKINNWFFFPIKLGTWCSDIAGMVRNKFKIVIGTDKDSLDNEKYIALKANKFIFYFLLSIFEFCFVL